MGINRDYAKQLIKAVTEHGIKGRCLSLGRQTTYLSVHAILELMLEYGLAKGVEGTDVALHAREEAIVKRRAADGSLLSNNPNHRKKGLISDALFFNLIGFDELKSVDIDSFEGADYLFDMNTEGIGAVIGEPVDMVIDVGTLEHIFHLPNVFRNIFEALAVGGHVMHFSPANNHLDHGFYQFSPTLFNDYYRANNYDVLEIMIYRHTMRGEYNDDDPWMIMEYDPMRFGLNYVGHLDDKVYGVFVLAKKTDKSTWDVIPQQKAYEIAWKALA